MMDALVTENNDGIPRTVRNAVEARAADPASRAARFAPSNGNEERRMENVSTGASSLRLCIPRLRALDAFPVFSQWDWSDAGFCGRRSLTEIEVFTGNWRITRPANRCGSQLFG